MRQIPIDRLYYHPSLTNLTHIGLDPYGNLPYNFSEMIKNEKNDYSNLMKRETVINFSKKLNLDLVATVR